MNLENANAALFAAFSEFGGCWTQVQAAPSYWVSSDGRVASFVKTPRVLKPIRLGLYHGVQLKHPEGKTRKHYIHRLVLTSWTRPGDSGEQCRHLDGNRDNNDLGNLAWGSVSENHRDKDLHGTSPRGERNPMAVLSEKSVLQMREMRRLTGSSYKTIAAQFGVSVMTAYRAITGQSWSNS